jgi:predicted DNA-binding protein YlxM (UPF0122 family)
MYKMEKLKQQIKDYQLSAGKMYMQYETDGYSQYQTYLYKRALYGLDALSQQELATMCSKKKQRIINVYKRAQVVLNKFKQELSIQYTNLLFKTLFPNSPITDALLANTETDEKFKNTLTFKDLGIEKKDIISIFIAEGILPKNFLSLDKDPNQLPRLKNQNV